MFKDFAFVLLSSILLTQCYQRAEANEEMKKIVVQVVLESVPISKYGIEHGSVLFEKVLEDVAVLKTPCEALHKRTTELSDFVKAVKEHADKHKEKEGDDVDKEIFELDEKFWDIIEKYNVTALETPTMEDLLIEASLYKNGYETFESEYEKHFLELLEKFYTHVDAYIATLTPAEHEEHKHFVDEWYPAFKAEKCIDKKEKLFEEYLKSVLE